MNVTKKSRILIQLVAAFVLISGAASNVAAQVTEDGSLHCLYSKQNFKGKKECGSAEQVNWVGWSWYRDISSLKVKEGYELVAFDRAWQFGQWEVFSGENGKLDRWKKRIASFHVREKQAEQAKVCFYSRKNYKGERFCTNDDLFWLGWYWNNRVSSVSIPAGKEVQLHDRWGYNGQSVTLSQSVSSLNVINFNNRASSITINDGGSLNDADNDGVIDSSDNCSDTPLGETVDEQGCSSSQLDTDNDGVSDALDLCSTTPVGEPVNSDGCADSQLDTDNDGINDAIDQCPATAQGEQVNQEGCALSQLDSDADGVNDAIDQCPDTSEGEQANGEGCALTQLDSDGDSVNDAVDQCPNTPAGEQANEEGCALSQLDTDNDGANDEIDQCPATPQGEQANAEGCAPSQLDTDNDGINDSIDQCQNTPEGEQANDNGCALSQLDTDNDGANDAIDQCPATPEGEQANAEGCAPSQLDTDNDGINDSIDQCQNTPAGEQANEEGCALSQLDTDNDGANDAIDQCPATPEGEQANADGCAPSQLDTDNDGTNDSIDQCPATPDGEQVDEQGCALSQLDTDNDGTNDAVDQCPETSEGEQANEVGCAPSQLDTDNDGVNDAIDQCPNTAEGEQVNADGCALSQLDTDNDGTNDATDLCPATPEGEPVNQDGCALTQLDTDNDGINDAIDQCPDTLAGEASNAEGCALTQLDTDNDGVNDALDQCPATPVGDTPNSEGCSPDQIDSDNDGTPDYLDAFPNDPNETSDIDGDGVGDNADPDRDGDGVLNEDDLFPNDATESSDLDGDGIGDNADPDRDGDGVNNEDDYFPTDPDASSVPTVQITSPGTLITVGSSPLRITGTVDDLNATLIINGIEIPQNNGAFEADVAIEEGANNIIVRAIDDKNHEGTATITVSLDKTPPYITVQSPEKGGKVFTDSISVSGLVNDIVRGTVSEDEALVRVASPLSTVTASVANRSYLAENVLLQEGDNNITITAQDAVGNENTDTFSVTYQPQGQKKIELLSGNAQSAKIKQALAAPLQVKLTENGQPVVDKTVVFRVTEGDGQLQYGTGAEGNGAVVKTSAEGIAQVTYQLGSRAGNGNQKVTARAVGFEGEVEFYHSATYGDGIQMGVIAGNNQRGAVRQPLAQPLVIAVTDAGANLIPNAAIDFEVTKGSGVFVNGETTYSTTTDMDGRASALFNLGPEEGLDYQRVTARLSGTNARVSFTSSGFLPGDPAQTKVSGVVLNNQDTPMPNVTIRIEGSSRQAVTDDQGMFTISEAPVGPVHLFVEGSTTTLAGEWPSLSYNIVTVPGVDNPLASPIYLVELDTENAVFVGREDTIVTHPDLPGFALDVKAGSVTFPDGSNEGMLSVTRVNANKIPMPPPNGMQPQVIVTLQPHGAKFDPPARLTLPNTDGYTPLAEVEMYSYDHDLEEFVTIGLGTVSKDGSTVTSNVGVGVIKAGWHCGSGPGGNSCPHNCGPCEDCDQNCVCVFVDNDPRLDSECQSCEELPGNKGRAIPANERGACTSVENEIPDDCRGPGCLNGSCDATAAAVDETVELQKTKPCMKCNRGKESPDLSLNLNPCGDGLCTNCIDGDCRAPSTEDCCAKADEGQQGGLVCCDGKKTICTFPKNYFNGVDAEDRCTIVHEEYHLNDDIILCNEENCNSNPFCGGCTGAEYECPAYAAGLKCYAGEELKCGGDVLCLGFVLAVKEATRSAANRNYGCGL